MASPTPSTDELISSENDGVLNAHTKQEPKSPLKVTGFCFWFASAVTESSGDVVGEDGQE